jgi:hypothetical protein
VRQRSNRASIFNGQGKLIAMEETRYEVLRERGEEREREKEKEEEREMQIDR